MLWETHIRMANEISRKLGISKSSSEADRLREGSVTPDKWKDYPHHHGKSGIIRKHILEARRFFLNGDLGNACFNLGVALHYVQDSYTSLSSRSNHHTRWEQQIEQAYFVDNLEELVASAFYDRADRREEYGAIARLLSNKIEGKEGTLRLATMPGPGLSFWGNQIWGRPNVDLNFAFGASLVIAKSVLGPRTCLELQTELSHVLMEYEAKLKKAEIIFADKVVALIKKRDELKRKSRKDGVLLTLRSCFSTLLSKIYNQRAGSKIRQYEKQKHLEKVVRAYREAAENLVAPHLGWYNITVPQIDINIVEKELLSAQKASEYFGISETIIKDQVKKGRISYYYVRDKELIRKSELEEVLPT